MVMYLRRENYWTSVKPKFYTLVCDPSKDPPKNYEIHKAHRSQKSKGYD